jgi:hypothetical protein
MIRWGEERVDELEKRKIVPAPNTSYSGHARQFRLQCNALAQGRFSPSIFDSLKHCRCLYDPL